MMKQSTVKCLFGLCLFWLLLAVAQAAPSQTLSERVQQQGSVRAIVQLDDAVLATPLAQQGPGARAAAAQQQLLQRLAERGVLATDKIQRRFQRSPALVMQLDAQTLTALQAEPMVRGIFEDRLSRPLLGESVPLIQANLLWAEGGTGSGWAVAVLDTGVEVSHPFFQDRVVAEACFSSNDEVEKASSLCPDGVPTLIGDGAGGACGLPDCDHGTHVAGIAMGYKDETLAGVAKEAGLIAIQVFSEIDDVDFCGVGTTPCVASYDSDQLAALEHVLTLHQADNGIQVAAVNMSLGWGEYALACDTVEVPGKESTDTPSKEAIDALVAEGVATVISSGNAGYNDAVSAPACISTAVAVGATNDSDTLATFSNHSELVDLLAPGVSIESAGLGGGYVVKSGTSMSAPHVAGAFAALRSLYPGAGVDELLNALKISGQPVATRTPEKPRIDLWGAHEALSVPASLQVDLVPQAAVDAGAQWRLEGGAWQQSGAVIEGLKSFQSVTVEFSVLDGAAWRSPAALTQTLAAGSNTITVEYAPVGSLRVDLSPLDAVEAGAKWRRTGQSVWRASGETESGVSPGSYVLEFTTPEGWYRPQTQSVTVVQGEVTVSSGTYTVVQSTPTSTTTTSSSSGGGALGGYGLLLLFALALWRVKRGEGRGARDEGL